MKTKQEQIEEMAFSTCDVPKTMQFLSKHRGESIKFENCRDCEFYNSCQHLNDTEYFYSAGYRKASDVIDEFAEKVLEKIRYEYENYPNVMTVGKYYQLRKEIKELAAEMRQEVK